MTEQTVLHSISWCEIVKIEQEARQRELCYFVTVAVGLFLSGLGMMVL